jgi:hypothetical protein
MSIVALLLSGHGDAPSYVVALAVLDNTSSLLFVSDVGFLRKLFC